jgi:heme oxygenase
MEPTVEAPTSDGIMARLKLSTADQHQHAESRPLQRSMAKGSVDREVFARYLSQLLLVHQSLENALSAARVEEPRIGMVNHSWQNRVEGLRQDLTFYGIDHLNIQPLPAAVSLINAIEQVARREPVSLLGMLYVLEGSTNGSKYIARALSRTFGIEFGSGPGLASLNPYGEAQMDRWQTFKRDMGCVRFTDSECDGIVESAKAMFDAIADLSDELLLQPA